MKKRLTLVALAALGVSLFSMGLNTAYATDTFYTQTSSSSHTEIRNTGAYSSSVNCATAGGGVCGYFEEGNVTSTETGTVTAASIWIDQYYSDSATTFYLNFTGGSLGSDCQLEASHGSNSGGYADLGEVTFSLSSGKVCNFVSGTAYTARVTPDNGNYASTMRALTVSGGNTPLKMVLTGTGSGGGGGGITVIDTATVNQDANYDSAININETMYATSTSQITALRWNVSSCSGGASIIGATISINGQSTNGDIVQYGATTTIWQPITPVTVPSGNFVFNFVTLGIPDVNTWYSVPSCHIDTVDLIGDGSGINPNDGGFAFVNFEPSLQSRNMRDFPFWSVRYEVPQNAGFANPPWYLNVSVATSGVVTAANDIVSNTVNVYQYGSHIQNFTKDSLSNGAYYYRISIGTSSTNPYSGSMAYTQGTFEIKASSSDGVAAVSSTNPYLQNVIGSLASTTSDTALNCSQYTFTDTYIGGTIPFFASSAGNRITCEIKRVVAWTFIPSEYAVADLQNEFNGYKTVVPFSFYFSVIEPIQNAAQGNVSSTASSSLSVTVPGFKNRAYSATGITFTVLTPTFLVDRLTSTHCNTACATAHRDTLWNMFRMVLWLTIGMAILAMIVKYKPQE